MRKGWCHFGWIWLAPAVCLWGCTASPPGDTDPDTDVPRAGSPWDAKALDGEPPANAGDGGGGAGGAAAGDACPGETYSLTAGPPLKLQGTLAGAADDLATFCADTTATADRADVVYQLSVTSEMTVTLQVTSNAFDPALSLRRTSCSEEKPGDVCMNFGAASETMKTALGAGTYWVVVDSADGAAGDFTLNITPTAPDCGDGVLNAGEDCDPGAGAADDGCFNPGHASAECKFGETPSNTDVTSCPGLGPINVSLTNDFANRIIEGPHHNGAGGKVQENDTEVDPAVCGWPAVGRENVFRVTPQDTGTLHARIGHNGSGQVVCNLNPLCGDFILYVRQTQCGPIAPADPLQQVACVDFDAGFQEILDVTVPVTASEDYWVFVDGLDDTWGLGPFWLELWMSQ